MRYQAIFGAIVFAALSGCASDQESQYKDYVLSEQTQLLPDSARVRPRGYNWYIEAYALNGSRRIELGVYATDCDDKSGGLWVENPRSALPNRQKVIWGTSTVADRFFTAICTVGIPMVDRAMAAESGRPPPRQMSPQERAVLLQQLLNMNLPQQAPSTETRCEREPLSRTGAIVCTQR